MTFSKGDFHLHTTASDGKSSPEALVALAYEKGIDIMAVTDHDTTLGVSTAVEAGKAKGVKVIPGIELSTLHNGESIHILGYFKDSSYEKKDFQDLLWEMLNFRVSRARKIIDNLDTFFNIKLDYEKIYESAKGVIARPHIARGIIDAGYDYTWEEIFDTLIGNDSPAYVPNKKLSIPEGLELLKSVNAVTVLAHPLLIKRSAVEDIIKYGFDGIEAIYALNSIEQTEHYKLLAKDNNLIITAGSDYHGGDKGDTKHGEVGCVSLQGEQLRDFLKLLNY
jgi:3',5'-nucleoside bisphosphate phosphatase